jgi:hypothetical protein
VALSGDGSWLASQRRDGALELQPVPPSRPPRALAPPLRSTVALAVAPDGTQLAAAGAGVVHLWTQARHRELEVEHDPTALAFIDGELLAVGETAGIELIYVPTGERWRLPAPRARVIALASSGSTLRALGDDGRVRTWPALPPAGAQALHTWLDTTTRVRLDDTDRLR